MDDLKERTIILCTSKHCNGKGSEEISQVLEKILKEKSLNKEILVEYSKCHHLHRYGPIIIIKPDNVLYTYVNTDNIEEIVNQHLINDKIVEKLLFKHPETGNIIKDYDEARVIVKQQKQKAS